MRVVLIFNPESGRGRGKTVALERALGALERFEMKVDVSSTERPGHATEIAARAAVKGIDRVLVWGGDGTLNEAARGLVSTETALGILPGGTVNVFAREVSIPLGIEAAVETFARGEVRRIPVGIASGRPFLLMTGVGLDAEVVRRLKAGFKRAFGVAAFWFDGFSLLARYAMPTLRIRSEEREIEASGVIAGKIRRYGPRYFITTEARLEEPLLHVVAFVGRNRRDYLRYLAGVVAGRHLGFEDVVSWKTRALTVESDDKVPFQVDGEPGGETPLAIGVREEALAVVLPRLRTW